MDILSDVFIKIWVAMNWRVLISCILTFFLITGFNKWIRGFDENGRLSAQEKMKSTGFFMISFVVISIVIYLLLDNIFGF
jgi:hypothetical protein